MAPIEEPPRELRVVATRVDLGDVSGRVLFPTPAQGPWMPFSRVAETVTTAAGDGDGEGHSHRQEEVLNYILEGEVEYEEEVGHRSVLGPGTVALFTAREPARHAVRLSRVPRARWLSVVIHLPLSTGGPPHRLQTAPSDPPARVGSGVLRRTLVGPGGPVTSATDFQCWDLEFPKEARCDWPAGAGRRVVAYVYDGSVSIDGRPVEGSSGALLENATQVSLRSVSAARLLLAIAPVE
jgi:quercetin 2,3-dioxygenase